MKPIILYIETSGTVCAVAIAQGEKILAEASAFEANSHAANAPVFIKQVLQETGLNTQQLHAVAISNGPGSYTGLRIGASLAKGICYAAQKPLIAVSTLQVMAHGLAVQYPNYEYCPMIDARRMEVYTAVYNQHLEPIMPETALVLQENSFENINFSKVIFFGSGSEKFHSVQPQARVENNFILKASHLITPVLSKFQQSNFENIAYYEPNYLKPFYSTKKPIL